MSQEEEKVIHVDDETLKVDDKVTVCVFVNPSLPSPQEEQKAYDAFLDKEMEEAGMEVDMYEARVKKEVNSGYDSGSTTDEGPLPPKPLVKSPFPCTDTNQNWKVHGCYSAIGGRMYQEDTFDAMVPKSRPIRYLAAVFDGHGGDSVSQTLSSEFLESLGSQPLDDKKTIYESINTTVEKFIDQFLLQRAGSTATFCVCYKEDEKVNIITANLGDTRAVLFHGNETKALSTDDTPHGPRGRLFQGCSSLAVSSSFGDSDFNHLPAFRTTATITHQQIDISKNNDDDHSFLVIASDGLWNVMDNEATTAFVNDNWNNNMHLVARNLVFESIERKTKDNVTAVVVNLSQLVI